MSSIKTPVKITQLYEHVELYSSGDPATNTLFILGQNAPSLLDTTIHFSIELEGESRQAVDELLLIDPPADAAERFKLEGNVAALYTRKAEARSLPVLATEAGGTAHIRVGQHYLDIYSYSFGELVHIPTLGLLMSGIFGSDVELPLLGDDSDGGEELDALRQAAALVKKSQFQLVIPHVGQMENDRISVMRRLADDVAYLHGLRRVVESAIGRGNDLTDLLMLSDSLIPESRKGTNAEPNHLLNIQTLFEAFSE